MKTIQNELLRVMCSISGKRMNILTPEIIVEATCSALNVDKHIMESALRARKVAEARFIISHLLSLNCKFSASEISPYIGDRDRSSVIYSLKIFHDLHHSSPEFRDKFLRVQKRLEELCG